MTAQTPPQDVQIITPKDWRGAMGYFPSGVTVVTTWDGENPVGSTISAFTSVSLEPPLLLICLDMSNPIREALERARVFGVNILHEEGAAIARGFGRPDETERFNVHAFRVHAQGAPQLEAAPVFIDCAVEDIHVAGDHLIVVGRGLRIEHTSTATPLLYHKGAFPKLHPPG